MPAFFQEVKNKEQTRQHAIYETQITKNDLQKKYRLGMVRKNLEEGLKYDNNPWYVISNNVAFKLVQTHTRLCSLLLCFGSPNDLQSVA